MIINMKAKQSLKTHYVKLSIIIGYISLKHCLRTHFVYYWYKSCFTVYCTLCLAFI